MSLIVFPDAPPPTVPITRIDDAFLNHLLVEFPNHLAIPTVMEHFCAPVGSGPANTGYHAREMAMRLSVHNNTWNGNDFAAPDRINNIATWIRRLKVSVNAGRRRRQADGRSVNLVPLNGQCLDFGSPPEREVEVPNAAGLRAIAAQALAELAVMEAAENALDAQDTQDTQVAKDAQDAQDALDALDAQDTTALLPSHST